ncbi:MAG: AAA family ATPase [Thermoanaerobaculia bacterium]
MLKRLHLKNFKGWEDTGPLELAPITVLFGSNSSGKTSLLQSLLLLKQTAASADRTRVLHTGDANSLVDLGTPSDIVFGHDTNRVVEIGLKWKSPAPIEVPKARLEELLFRLEVGFSTEGSPHVRASRYHSQDGLDVGMVRRPDANGYDFHSTPALTRRQGRPPAALPDPIRFYGFPSEVQNLYQKADWLSDLTLALEHQLERIQYVGPLREYPSRTYLWSGEKPESVGTRGRDAVAALLSARAEGRKIPRGEKTGTRYEAFDAVIAWWLKRMKVIDSFKVERISKNRKDYEVQVKRTPSSAEVLITDVGFGVSQLLPVLVQCYYAATGSTVIFEQPEIHLHPRVQADLADVLLDAVKRCNVQFLVESHSEHFLRRLQRRVAEWGVDERGIGHDKVALYVCDVVEGHSRIERLKVDDFGNILNWPKDFFGDEMGDLTAMADAAMRRQEKP